MPNVTRSTAAIVVTGGDSRRMGVDKALLPIHGQPLLLWVIRQLLSEVDTVIVVARLGQVLPTFPQNVLVTYDPQARERTGPLGACLTGLEIAAQHDLDRCFLSACDTPRVTGAHVRWMFDQLGEEDAVVPSDGEHLYGLSAVVRTSAARRAAEAAWLDGQRALRHLFLRMKSRVIELEHLPEPDAVRGCNTPEEWAALTAESP